VREGQLLLAHGAALDLEALRPAPRHGEARAPHREADEERALRVGEALEDGPEVGDRDVRRAEALVVRVRAERADVDARLARDGDFELRPAEEAKRAGGNGRLEAAAEELQRAFRRRERGGEAEGEPGAARAEREAEARAAGKELDAAERAIAAPRRGEGEVGEGGREGRSRRARRRRRSGGEGGERSAEGEERRSRGILLLRLLLRLRVTPPLTAAPRRSALFLAEQKRAGAKVRGGEEEGGKAGGRGGRAGRRREGGGSRGHERGCAARRERATEGEHRRG
jgi:hypothetical protein